MPPACAQVKALLAPAPATALKALGPLGVLEGDDDGGGGGGGGEGEGEGEARAAVGALSRIKAGRCVFLSQLVGDCVLRVAPADAAHGLALALECVVGGRRWRLEVSRDAVLDVATRADEAEASRRAESRWECAGCGRRFGSLAHYTAHCTAPCGKAAAAKPRKAGGDGADGPTTASRKRKRSFAGPVATARIVLDKAKAPKWKYETAASLGPPPGGASFFGARASWADDGDDLDPLSGEAARVAVLTLRPRKGTDLDALLAPLLPEGATPDDGDAEEGS